MKKFFLLLVIGLSAISFAQQDSDEAEEFRSILFSNLHIMPSDSSNNIFYTYKLPYNRLVFVKNGNKYTAEFNITIEVFDSGNNFVVRTYSNKRIETNDFESTNSRDLYSEGFCQFEVGKGEFNILPLFSDVKSGREIKLKARKLVTSKYNESGILEPLIVNADSFKCNGKEFYALANFESNFPFSEEKFDMLIPVTDLSVNSIHVSVVKAKDTLLNETISESFLSGILFDECSNKVVLTSTGSGKKTRNFVVQNFSNNLSPGNIVITVSEDKNTKPEKTFQKSVIWYNKPLSLNNPEYAIKVLKHIEGDSVVNRLLNEDSDNYQQVLLNYWEKYDPTPGTSFNPLMVEFYQRVDYAAMNFTPIDGKSGSDTDRGKILIQFGQPNKIERASNGYGKVVETWVYEKPQRKFIFVDQKGTGNFSLTKG
ncbi:MAG: GWxTD domain-containing protein [Ignavibacteriaceae bacterium]